MRNVAAVVALALAASMAVADHGDAVRTYVDASGAFLVGLVAVGVGAVDDGDPVPPSGVGPVNLQRFPFAAETCHSALQIVLDYAPRNASAATEAAYVALPYRMQVELFDDATGGRLGAFPFDAPGAAHHALPWELARGHPLRADLYLLRGADVDWSLRVRGWNDPDVPCVRVAEVEPNPDGWDAGNEWVELHNAGGGLADVSGWTLRTTHGVTASLTLPEGTVLGLGERRVVTFPAQALDNVDESVVLEDASGTEADRTPVRSDEENDARSWQRGADGAWTFADATPGS